ncbi:hypothetical protein BDW66DRAFT_132570 [Aspergillus desertorum]
MNTIEGCEVQMRTYRYFAIRLYRTSLRKAAGIMTDPRGSRWMKMASARYKGLGYIGRIKGKIGSSMQMSNSLECNKETSLSRDAFLEVYYFATGGIETLVWTAINSPFQRDVFGVPWRRPGSCQLKSNCTVVDI